MQLKHHKNLTYDKWSRYSRAQQILMIGTELNRAKNSILRNDFCEVKNCYERALELLHLTIEGITKSTELKEFLRFKEILGLLYIQKSPQINFNNKLYKALLTLNKDSYL